MKRLGGGSYGTVNLVQKKDDNKMFALKSIHKEIALKYDKTRAILRERDIHNILSGN